MQANESGAALDQTVTQLSLEPDTAGASLARQTTP
jgi:hypothetical protein